MNAGEGLSVAAGHAVPPKVVYPSMMGLLPPKLDIHQGVLPGYFQNPNCKLVVGIVLADGEAIHLVHQVKEPPKSQVRVVPQETVEYMVDSSLVSAIIRGLAEELGLHRRHVELYPVELHRFENHIPVERTGGVPRTKCIVYFGARTHKDVVLSPNPAEVREVLRAGEQEYLDFGLESRRVPKCMAQSEAIIAALGAGLLDKRHWPHYAGIYNERMSRHQVH